MDRQINRVFEYFSYFGYPPTLEEIHSFISKNISKSNLEKTLFLKVKKRSVLKIEIENIPRFQLLRFRDKIRGFEKRYYHSRKLIKSSFQYLKILGIIPDLRYLGISGSLSMKNASKDSDIDIFVITKAEKIWSVRYALLLYKSALRLFVPEIGLKLCFNLFFAENGLLVGKQKRTEYIGHELFQLMSIVNKDSTYEKLLVANFWTMKIFPNVQLNYSKKQETIKSMQQAKRKSFVESFLSVIQKRWLNIRNYSFQEKSGQLWLIQRDFEERIKKLD